ncbi:MAG: amidohydrolase family protein, partial [Prevotellaceae bacterium]|nr:amidohydrolase family protein [Prevotellaceae bacterium]
MRKISANYIFPINAKPIENGVLTIDDDGKITELSDISENRENGDSIEFYEGVICPGFVNAHCHLELSHLKNLIPQHTGIVGFITGISEQRNIADAAEQLRLAKFYDEFMRAQGIVAVGDISNNDLTFELKKHSKIFYHTFVEVFSCDENETDKILQKNQAIIDYGKRLGLSISPTLHAPYSMCDKLFSEIKFRAQQYGILSYHNQESQAENDYFENNSGDFLTFYEKFKMPDNPTPTGKTAIHRLLENINKQTKILLVHNTFTSENDYDFAVAANENITWTLCPQSNLYIENRLPPVEMLRRKNAKIAIGTDSLSSNTDISIIAELLAIAEKHEDITLAELLTWATINGAKALGKDDILGTLEIGKTPGIVLIKNVDLQKMKLTEKSLSV